MNILVISLEKSQERRDFQTHQLNQLGLHFSFFDAITANTLQEFLENIDLNHWERPLMPTEQACFLSHFHVWKKIAQGNKPILVMEDDAILSSNTPDFLKKIECLNEIDHVSLETRARRKLIGDQKPLTPSLGMARLYQDRTGAAAYILWPSGAQKLIQATKTKGAALADAKICNSHNLMSYQALPALAIQADVSNHYGIKTSLKTHSYIQALDSKNNYKTTGYTRLKFKYRRIKSQIKQLIQQLKNLPNASRKYVNTDPSGFTYSEHP